MFYSDFFILQMAMISTQQRKLLREIKGFAQGHTASQRQSWDAMLLF